MAEPQSTNGPQLSQPTRNVIITGERCAKMYLLTVNVSQVEQRMLRLSMGQSVRVREAYRRTNDRLQSALNFLEDELKAITRELEAVSRPTAGAPRGQSDRQQLSITRPPAQNGNTAPKTEAGQNGNGQQPAKRRAKRKNRPKAGAQDEATLNPANQQQREPQPVASQQQEAKATAAGNEAPAPEVIQQQHQQAAETRAVIEPL